MWKTASATILLELSFHVQEKETWVIDFVQINEGYPNERKKKPQISFWAYKCFNHYLLCLANPKAGREVGSLCIEKREGSTYPLIGGCWYEEARRANQKWGILGDWLEHILCFSWLVLSWKHGAEYREPGSPSPFWANCCSGYGWLPRLVAAEVLNLNSIVTYGLAIVLFILSLSL